MSIEIENIYADYELDTDNMFAVTPEGNRFRFDSPEFTDKHEPVLIVDPSSHKQYNVIFNE